MNRWIDDLAEISRQGEACILLTIAGVRGSAPREVGARMLVTATTTIGTIGGGQLEYQCTQLAVEQLRQTQDVTRQDVRRFPLGTNCGQCCGGVVDVLFELIDERSTTWINSLQALHHAQVPAVIATSLENAGQKFLISAQRIESAMTGDECPPGLGSAAAAMLTTDECAQQQGKFLLEPLRPAGFHIALFGAGHVGTATVDVLARLDANIRWIDSRRKIFPLHLPDNVIAIPSTDPALEVAAMPAGAYYLVMTHSHPLDLEICARVLRRGDVAYCGLIGSLSKRRRFERLLRKQGMTDDSLQQLICPIGIAGIEGKKPAEIALSVAAQILRKRDSLRRAATGAGGTAANLRAI
jgi:xanthine dehydrogenase accessory factor